MFGKLKKLFGGGAANDAVDGNGVVSLTPADLDNPAQLGAKLVAYARMKQHITSAEFDPQREEVRLTYASGNRGSVHLGNLIATMRTLSDGEAVANYLENTFADPFTQEKGVLLPVLKSVAYAETAQQQRAEAGDTDMLWCREVVPGLVMTLVRDTPSQMQIMTERSISEAGLDDDAAIAEAIDSLVDYVNAQGLRVSGMSAGELSTIELDGNYEASVFFLGDVWDNMAQTLGGAPAVIFAARNVVVFANSADPGAMTLLQQVAASDQDHPAYAIAPNQIWLWQDGAWTPYETPAAALH